MKAQKHEDTTKKDIQALLPVLIALCIIPLIILTKDYETEFSQFIWFNNEERSQIDSFEYAKSILVIIMGGISAAILCFREYSNTQKKKRLFEGASIPVCVLWGIYLIMVILSSVLSKYPNLAFTGGGYGQWQTMWVLLAYGMLFMYAYLYINSENRGILMIKCMMITTGLLSLLGTLQTAGCNPLKWQWVQNIITSRSTTEAISFADGVSSVILSFNNPNYVGPYIALVLPVVIAFIAIRASEDKTKRILCKIAGVLIAAGLVISLFGVSSSAGLIAVAGGIVFAVILILASVFSRPKPEKEAVCQTGEAEQDPDRSKKNFPKKGILIGAAAVVLLVAAGIFAVNSTFVKNTANRLLQGSEDTRNIASIVNKKDELKVTLRNDTKFTLGMHFDQNGALSFTAYDDQKQPIEVQYDSNNNQYTLSDERFSMITLNPNNFSLENNIYSGFKFNDVPNSISFTFMYVDGEWKYYTPFGKLMKLHTVESFGFKDSQNIANRRGFIWSRTIPLMKDYWFTGIGPNAFIIAFPNDDFVGSKRVGDTTTLVDKPHNAFLQTFIQTGGVSAIAYAGLWIVYMVCGIRILWGRKKYTDLEKISMGLLTGMFAFFIAELTNDTVVGTQNIYWILLGTGFAINRIICAERSAAAARKQAEQLKNTGSDSAKSKKRKKK